MTTIISGAKGAAKTRRLLELYGADRRGDGFVSEEVTEDGRTTGYSIRRLRDGRTVPFMVPAENPPAGWMESFGHGHWSFSVQGMSLAEEVVADAIAAGTGPVYIDEIGKLELRGGGFAGLLRQLLDAGIELVIAVRAVNVEAVVRTFEPGSYRIIESDPD